MKRTITVLSVLTACSILGASLSGCGSGAPDTSNTLSLAICAPVADEEAITALETSLKETMPAEVLEGLTLDAVGISMGDSKADPMMAAAGIARFAGMTAAKEIDVMLSNYEDARRNAANGTYIPLSELFTQEELDAMGCEPAVFELYDDEGNPTGEYTDALGIDLSGSEELTQITGGEGAYLMVVSNTENLEAAKELFRQLAGR